MILKVTKAFTWNDKRYIPGMTVKMGTRDYKAHEDSVKVPDKFTKVVSNKRKD